MRLRSKFLAGLAVALFGASCAADDSCSFWSHSGGRRPDKSRFTLNWVHKVKSQATAEYLSLTIPNVPIGELVEIDGNHVEARFAHSEGVDCYDPIPGVKETEYCPHEHAVQGSVLVLDRSPGAIRAALRVTVACPDKGRYDIEGEHTFETESVLYR